MFHLNELQQSVIGWFMTVGISSVILSLSILIVYGIYSTYKLIKKFANEQFLFYTYVFFLIYIRVMRVHYTNIKRWDTFTNCECVDGDIV